MAAAEREIAEIEDIDLDVSDCGEEIEKRHFKPVQHPC